MFNVSPISLNTPCNGWNAMIVASASDADAVIREFKNRMCGNVDPNVLIEEIFEDFDLSEDDFTKADIERINKSIRSIYEANRRRF